MIKSQEHTIALRDADQSNSRSPHYFAKRFGKAPISVIRQYIEQQKSRHWLATPMPLISPTWRKGFYTALDNAPANKPPNAPAANAIDKFLQSVIVILLNKSGHLTAKQPRELDCYFS